MDNNQTEYYSDISLSSFPPAPTSHKNIPFEKIAELRDKGLSTGQIAKIIGCSKTNVIIRLKYQGYDTHQIKLYKNKRPDLFAWMQDKLLSSITDEDIKKTPVGSRVLAMAQLYDKERLETDQSTSNQAVMLGLDKSVRQGLTGLSTLLAASKTAPVTGNGDTFEGISEDAKEDVIDNTTDNE